MIFWNVTGTAGDRIGLELSVKTDKITSPYSKIFIFNSSYFGLYPLAARNESPQTIDFASHSIKIEEDLDKPTAPNSISVPKDFDGLIVPDYESWSPWYRLAPENMKVIAREQVKKIYPIAMPNFLLEKAAEVQFNRAAQKFFLTTIRAIKKARPLAKVGFYGFPFTWNYPNHAEYGIPFNDYMLPIYSELDVLLPSIYMLYPNGFSQGNWVCTEEDQKAQIDINLIEAQRVKDRINKNQEIIPYCWHRYHDVTGIQPAGQLMTLQDLKLHLSYPATIKNRILWGWEMQEGFSEYSETILKAL